MTNEERFIEDYKTLELVVRQEFHLPDNESISYALITHPSYKKYENEINYCQKIRNCLQHNNKINGDFPAVPSNAMINFIEDLINKVSNRKRCCDIAIPFGKIYNQTMNGSVYETMRIMQAKMYTNVPILQNKIVVGVFDENSLFSYLSAQEMVMIDLSTKFSDIEPFLSVNNREMEEFLFVRPNLYADELEDKIEKAFGKNKRVNMAFVTSTGKANAELTGIITPWDIIASNRERK